MNSLLTLTFSLLKGNRIKKAVIRQPFFIILIQMLLVL